MPDGDQPRPNAAEFKLSITRAMRDQLADELDALRPAPLSRDQLDQLKDDQPGVYELYLNGIRPEHRVYVGKASKSLKARLGEHLRKLSGRTNINVEDVGFVCLYVDEDLEAAAPEKLLIKKYRGAGGVPWNTMGFGNKDPGRNRDGSVVKAKHFDAQYPIDLDRVVNGVPLGSQTVVELLNAVKTDLPYNLRFETTEKIKSELSDTSVTITSSALSTRELMRLTINALPAGWQATALPGYVILYHEARHYKSAKVFWRKQEGHAAEFAGEGRLDLKGKVKQDDEEQDE